MTYNLEEIMLEGQGVARVPALILVNTAINLYEGNTVKLKPGQQKERKLIYSFPESITPTHLIIENNYRISVNGSPKPGKIYYDDNWQTVSAAAGATYYRTTEKSAIGWVIRDYFISNDQIQMESEVSSLYPEVREGKTTWYHTNGQVKETGYFQVNNRNGLFVRYYESGQIQSRTEYSEKEARFLQIWDEGGDSLLVSGSGVYQAVNGVGNATLSVYQDHHLEESLEIRKDEGDTVYTVVDAQPEYPGGMQAFYQYIAASLRYPRDARKSGVQGRVYVQFVIDETGAVTEVKAVKGISATCDEESERVLKESLPWKPGQAADKAVKVRMVLPIIFKLS